MFVEKSLVTLTPAVEVILALVREFLVTPIPAAEVAGTHVGKCRETIAVTAEAALPPKPPAPVSRKSLSAQTPTGMTPVSRIRSLWRRGKLFRRFLPTFPLQGAFGRLAIAGDFSKMGYVHTCLTRGGDRHVSFFARPVVTHWGERDSSVNGPASSFSSARCIGQ